MTTTQWITIGVIVGIFALGFLPGPRQPGGPRDDA
jgi:hypothetical protein